MQSAASRIWISDAVSISQDDNHYTTGTSHSYTNFLKYNIVLKKDFFHSNI